MAKEITVPKSPLAKYFELGRRLTAVPVLTLLVASAFTAGAQAQEPYPQFMLTVSKARAEFFVNLLKAQAEMIKARAEVIEASADLRKNYYEAEKLRQEARAMAMQNKLAYARTYYERKQIRTRFLRQREFARRMKRLAPNRYNFEISDTGELLWPQAFDDGKYGPAKSKVMGILRGGLTSASTRQDLLRTLREMRETLRQDAGSLDGDDLWLGYAALNTVANWSRKGFSPFTVQLTMMAF